MNLNQTINKASQILKSINIQTHQLDAEIILSEIMGVKKEFLITNDNLQISNKVKEKYFCAIKRRIKKEPVAFITGKKEFWSENFKVNYNTLVPRPETELLVHNVIKILKNRNINILDIGTGSGCILLSLLKELRFSRGLGIDISSSASKIAKENSNNLNLTNRSKFKVYDIKNFKFGKYDLIVSNPPYIPFKDIRNLSESIKNFEPISALNGGNDGLDIIRKVIYKSCVHLKNNGLLAVEIGNGQYIKVSKILRKFGLREVKKVQDYKSNVRCIISTKTRFF